MGTILPLRPDVTIRTLPPEEAARAVARHPYVPPKLAGAERVGVHLAAMTPGAALRRVSRRQRRRRRLERARALAGLALLALLALALVVAVDRAVAVWP